MNKGIAYGSYEAEEETDSITRKLNETAKLASRRLAKLLGAEWGDHSIRNAQLTLLAPCGTISFAMDCQSTGIEPVFAKQQTKVLVGGGTLTVEPDCVVNAKEKGHKDAIRVALSDKANEVVTPQEHLLMMGAAQPHLSGAISKTINMPSTCTWKDIRTVYEDAWELGLKCVAVFRDGCKAHQPLQVKTDDSQHMADEAPGAYLSVRTRLADTRESVTHKFNVGGQEGYMTVGLFDDGTPGELFMHVSKAGSTLSGLMDAWATAVSLLLQYGVPLAKIVEKFSGTRFEPAGFTSGDTNVKTATSVVDYAVRWLDDLCKEKQNEYKDSPSGNRDSDSGDINLYVSDKHNKAGEGNICPDCGSVTVRTGTCKTCPTCGWGGGCG